MRWSTPPGRGWPTWGSSSMEERSIRATRTPWPEASVETLLLPTNAPWLKAPELIDYVVELAPRRAYSVHDGFLNEAGLALVDGILSSLAEERHADIRRLEPGAWVDPPSSPLSTRAGCVSCYR